MSYKIFSHIQQGVWKVHFGFNSKVIKYTFPSNKKTKNTSNLNTFTIVKRKIIQTSGRFSFLSS